MYVVIKKIGDCDGRVIREFDALGNAISFVSLLRLSETNRYASYEVAEVLPNPTDVNEPMV